jgi:hypothetical protein
MQDIHFWGGTIRPRIPEDAFEKRLFEEHIRRHIENWPEHLHAGITENGLEDGAWTLVVSRDFWPSPDNPTLIGKIWMAEREYPATEAFRVCVAWSLGDQVNVDNAPVVDFEED